MSEVKSSEPVYAPAVFLKEGRFPSDPQAVMANYYQQTTEVERYRQQLNAQLGLRGASNCARSLFFDSANNRRATEIKAGFERKTPVAEIFRTELNNSGAACMNSSKGRALWQWVGSCLLFLLLAGCSAGQPKFLAGNLNGVNHTSAAINHFSVNGYGGRNISPFGYGGGACCVMLPSQWAPGLKFKVEWETDPNSNARLPPLGTNEYRAAYAKHKAKYQQHSAIVELPPYEEKLCSLEVHFLPCNQVKVSTSCWRYPSPNSPIKEPLEMKESAVCPK